jgi:hypothetical protein
MSNTKGKKQVTNMNYDEGRLKSMPSPREFMKGRRPQLFSDTPTTGRPRLSRDMLEFRLEHLTTRDEHFQFENLCKKLVLKKLCYNIKPSTGPSAGGDGKTDAATFPVSDELKLRCYTGSAQVAGAEEKWGFAFSCKKDWKAKAKSDIKAIAELKRNHKKGFFISSQPIRKKLRDELEVELSEKHAMTVEILDRSWIVQCIIDEDREEVAIESLAMDSISNDKPSAGPQDYARSEELAKLESNLQNIDDYFGNDIAIVQDYLRAAKLARGLDLPREKMESFYFKAIDISTDASNSKLKIRSMYLLAWSTYWWFNDPEGMLGIYGQLEAELNESCDAEDCERFVILLNILRTAETIGLLPPHKVDYQNRRGRLERILQLNIQDSARPNNSLQAETLLLGQLLTDSLLSRGNPKPLFDKLSICLSRADGLGKYPAMRFINTLMESGDMIGELPGYDDLFENMARIAESRSGEVFKGQLLFDRGLQKAKNGDPHEALKLMGRARILLSKEETFSKSIHATLACSDLYMSLGLPWAARSEALAASHMALTKDGGVYLHPWEGMLASKRLMWIETILGRIPSVLAWQQLTLEICAYLKGLKFDLKETYEEIRSLGDVLGCLILILPDKDVERLNALESTLVSMELFTASGALLYRRGDIDAILSQSPDVFHNDRQEVIEMFEQGKNQPVCAELPKELPVLSSEYSQFSSEIFGVTFCIRTRNRFECHAFAENLLGILEAAFALAKWEELAFIVDRVDFTVDINSRGENPPPLDLDNIPDSNHYDLYFRDDMGEWLYTEDRRVITKYLHDLVIMLLVHITIDPKDDLMAMLESWHKDDTFSRALGLSPTIIPLRDLLGRDSYDYKNWQ